MSKFNSGAKISATVVPSTAGPMATAQTSTTKTFEGAAGFQRDARTDLFLHSTASFAGEDTFYEKADERTVKLRALTARLAVTPDGFTWLSEFVPWLRGTANMRTAPVMIAVEAVHARLKHDPWLTGGNRQIIDAACQRLDDVTEIVACWSAWYGIQHRDSRTYPHLPIAVKKGLADALQRLLTERSFLRYDSQDKPIRIGDVVELAHPRAKAPWQGELYAHAIDVTHGHLDRCDHPKLRTVRTRGELSRFTPEQRHERARVVLNMMRDGSLSTDDETESSIGRAMAGQWEWVHSWLGDGADIDNTLTKAERWQLVLPQLGYMALIRNLRNLDEAGLDDARAQKLAEKISDPEEVKRSRQLPFRFLSAYLNAPSLRWAQALEAAAHLSVSNVPELSGRTLVLVDTSGSMDHPLSKKSKVTYAMAGALFGLALALRSPGSIDLYGFADNQFKATPNPSASLLRATEQFVRQIGSVGHGTQTFDAIRETYQGHDRVIVITDEQTFDDSGNILRIHRWGWASPAGPTVTHLGAIVPETVPMYAFNLAGYSAGSFPTGHNRYTLGGLTDQTFSLIKQLEAMHDGGWPWEMTGGE